MTAHSDPLDAMTQSKLGLWLDCQQKFKAIYVDGLRRPPNAILAYGDSWDRLQTAMKGVDRNYGKGIETHDGYYCQKLRSKEPTPAQTQELAVQLFEEEANTVEDWVDEDVGTMKDSVASGAKSWAWEVGRLYEPLALQVPYQVRFDEGWTNRGTLDMVGRDAETKTPFIIDAKTSKRKWAEKKALSSYQPASYTFGASQLPNLSGVSLDIFEFHVHVRTKVPQNQIIRVNVTQADRDRYLVMQRVARRQIELAMQTGEWMPNRESILCSKKWCPFWQQCQNEWGGVIPD